MAKLQATFLRNLESRVKLRKPVEIDQFGDRFVWNSEQNQKQAGEDSDQVDPVGDFGTRGWCSS